MAIRQPLTRLKAVLQQYPQCSAIRRKSLLLSGKPRILGRFYCDLNYCRLLLPSGATAGVPGKGRRRFAAVNAGLTGTSVFTANRAAREGEPKGVLLGTTVPPGG
jgi:hypothetical protein